MTDYEKVLSLWIGPLDAQGRARPEQARRWYRKDPAFDEHLRQELADDHRAAMAGAREHWRATPRGRLAYVILLDQISRNLYRGSPEMYAGDERALEASREAIEAGEDRDFPLDERCFFYLPFMHSETLEDQERCVALFTTLKDDVGEALKPRVDNSLRYAVQHRDIVARFSRFPHRNAILGRSSTPSELAFLNEPGSSF